MQALSSAYLWANQTYLNMKYSIFGLLAFFTLLFATAPSAQAQSTFDNWPALGEFHKVMAQTFHPMEDGDLKPIRNRSGEMAQKAAALKKSKIPAEFNRPEIRQALADLQRDSKKLNKQIKKGATDEAVTKALTGLHDTFHKIVGLCSATGEH